MNLGFLFKDLFINCLFKNFVKISKEHVILFMLINNESVFRRCPSYDYPLMLIIVVQLNFKLIQLEKNIV